MEHAVELMMGVGFLVLGASMFLRTADWTDWLSYLAQRGRHSSLILGIVNLLMGAFVVSFHWVWEGVAAVVTIFGVLFIVRSCLLLLFPGFLPEMLRRLQPRADNLITFAGLIVGGIALMLLYDWSIQTGLSNGFIGQVF